MSRIKIQNFGPIKEGFNQNEGWMEIKKVTVLIGSQGSGKSTVAKLISTISWIEKALMRGEVSEKTAEEKEWFRSQCAYQNIKSYFRRNTIIYYEGDGIHFSYLGGQVSIEQSLQKNYYLPKIMYVPAERNFISAVRNVRDLKGLPSTLYTFADEFFDGLKESKEFLTLPINDASLVYDSISEIPMLVGKGFRLKLSEAASGFQSLVPLYVVTKYLSTLINNRVDHHKKQLSLRISENLRRDAESIINNPNIAEDLKKIYLENLTSRYYYSALLNIVEEPEQNLYPSSQRKVLNMLLEFNNLQKDNILVMTTHSPYIINYLTLATKAGELFDSLKNIPDNEKAELNNVVPIMAAISGNELAIYELDENKGVISLLETFGGLPSDDNWLNEELGATNDLFSDLIAFEQKLSR